MNFILTCESTVDTPYSEVAARDIPVIFYKYIVNGEEFEDDMRRDPDGTRKFYDMIDRGAKPGTSQLNEYEYTCFLEEQLKKGDVLHITLSSGLTKSYENAKRAEAALREKYPERRLEVYDSLSGCFGYWLLTEHAADMRDAGASVDEVIAWLDSNKLKVRHQFFSTRMDFFRRSGRVSGPVSAIATLLNIIPSMRLDAAGHIIAYAKNHGKKAAIQFTVKEILEKAKDGADFAGSLFIGHTNCPELARQTEDAIKAALVKAKTRILDIGSVIASHCGPGTVAVFFMGDAERA